jgi:hypothetical protein
MKSAARLLACVVLLLAPACKAIGPRTIARDRMDYSGELAKSWKNQMLLNLVKTRYLDLPLFLEVGQIVSGYSLETAATVGLSLPETDSFGGDTGVFGGSARFTERPTITYTPLIGDRFLEGFLRPIDPKKVFALVQANFAADFILALSVDSLNGLQCPPTHLGAQGRSDPGYYRALTLVRTIQEAGALEMRTEKAADGATTLVVHFRDDPANEGAQGAIEELREVLGLAPGMASYRLVDSPQPGEPGDLAVSTRSLSQMMSALAQGVEIPPAHGERKLTPPLAEDPAAAEHMLLCIRSGPGEPDDAFVSVRYEGQWFWIANDDWQSKRTFSSILFLFTLADAGGEESMPVLTIPTQ